APLNPVLILEATGSSPFIGAHEDRPPCDGSTFIAPACRSGPFPSLPLSATEMAGALQVPARIVGRSTQVRERWVVAKEVWLTMRALSMSAPSHAKSSRALGEEMAPPGWGTSLRERVASRVADPAP